MLLNVAACTGSAQEEGTTTILDLIGDNENFVIIAGAFNNSSLINVLTGNETHTVFLPTDQAFENMSEGTLEELTADPAALEQVLLYHVTNGTLMSEDLANVSNITTLQGSQLPVNATEEGIFVGNAKVIQANVTADNGVVHVIDTVLIPPESPLEGNDIIETATQEGNFTTLLLAFGAANLTDTLKGEGPFTLFAPTDEAFSALPNGTIEALLNDTDALNNVLLYHVANESLMAENLTNVSNITTLQGSELPVNVTEEGVFIGNAQVTVQDINASNGVIHAIDAVLIPEEAVEGPIELYNDTVDLTEGNFTFTPENSMQTYTVDNFTDIGALNVTGLQYNVSVQGVNLTNMTNMSVLEGIEGIRNNNETGIMWFVYINGTRAEEDFGMNPVSNGTNLNFWYTTEENGEAAIENATYVANVTVAIEEEIGPESGPEPEQNLTELYNDSVSLIQGNTMFMPENSTQSYRVNNFTDFGVLAVTGLEFNASLMQNMTGNMTQSMAGNMTGNQTGNMTGNMTNMSFILQSIEGIKNNNTTGEKWFVYINGEPAEENFGINPVSSGDNLSFWYTTEEGGEAAIENATYVANVTVDELIARANIIPAAQNQTNLTTFVNAVQTANLTQTLNGTTPYTVCIPNNEAFDKLPAETRSQLMNNTTLLREVLSYHVLSGRFTREQLASTSNVTNIQGNVLQVNTIGNNIKIQNVNITQIIIVNNGVICIIDEVLVPPGSGIPAGNQTDGNQTGGWYFFSIPFEANNTSVDYLLSDVNYTFLIYYNASTRLFEDVSDIEPLKAYWINVPNGTEFNASEQFSSVEKKQIIAPPSLQVYPGWNALGSPVNETVPAEAAFIILNNSSLNSSYVKIVGPWVPGNNTTGYYQYVGYNSLNGTIGENQLGADEFEVEPYEGYWVFIRQENLYG
ncbi:hypothetical protein MSHOH_2584 [Methanosarcina horonobensis HB-1 = JCM 15518]|uniref:FAS1 domain-containing protein n=1 Tax=Methanosarcina horonobensis HB-1 = JCM 15518 TaxID=1434110 RepID=A0A0E3SFP4_9EURY|nr:fasciclin domain-containing protein [Methanosarcina horonobensis]AKB79067.1 hypothetical protein MSHOH_2584 [Methanosarcina horonobensis HB-1 = JCM 15518]